MKVQRLVTTLMETINTLEEIVNEVFDDAVGTDNSGKNCYLINENKIADIKQIEGRLEGVMIMLEGADE